MRVRPDLAPLRQTRWHGHVLRFAAGGLATVATGLIAKAAGPVVGGLFLAFPAIFPIGLATTERLHDREAGAGARGDRARRAGICEAVGAAAGCVGLAAFAVVAWLALGPWPAPAALAAATGAWVACAFGGWAARRVLVTVPSRRATRRTA